jgi:hypothetical protein
LSAHGQRHVGSFGYVLSYQALNVAAPRGPDSSGAYPVLENNQV